MNWLARAFVRTNALLFQLTGGRLGSQLGKQSILLLHTVGRKTGQVYTTPLAYYRDGELYLVVASNWGKDVPPNWFRNLMQSPRTAIQTRGGTFRVEARVAEGDERQRLWKLVTRRNPQYLRYQQAVTRQIPIVILTLSAPD
jgi:deazaflavin-dependent oxidoreductase (nitroreductase family)